MSLQEQPEETVGRVVRVALFARRALRVSKHRFDEVDLLFAEQADLRGWDHPTRRGRFVGHNQRVLVT